MFIPRRTTVFLRIATKPVKAGCSLFLRWASDSEPSLVSQSISLDRSGAVSPTPTKRCGLDSAYCIWTPAVTSPVWQLRVRAKWIPSDPFHTRKRDTDPIVHDGFLRPDNFLLQNCAIFAKRPCKSGCCDASSENGMPIGQRTTRGGSENAVSAT
jgi:hypothetical protein